MNELERLLNRSDDELGLAMLRAASEEGPSDESFKAAAAALGLTGAALSVGSSASASGTVAALGVSPKVGLATTKAASTASLSVGIVAKHVFVGMLGGAVAMGGVSYVSEQWASPPAPNRASLQPLAAAKVTRSSSRPLSTEAGVAPMKVESAAVAVSPLSSSPRRPLPPVNPTPSYLEKAAEPLHAPALDSGSPLATGAAAFSAEAEPAASAAPTPSALARNKSLAVEVALLDRARRAVMASDPNEALKALDQYRRQRPSSILEPEAAVLNRRALEQLQERRTLREK